MGIDSYVSRVPLPNAAPSRRLKIVRRAVPAEQGATPPVAAFESPGAAQLRSSLAASDDAAAAETTTAAPAQAAPTGTDIPIFSVAAVSVGGWYWLEEIPPGREPGSDYTQLLQAICRALGLPDDNPRAELFKWPLHNSSQLDQSAEAARHGLSGFLSGRLERIQPSGVILLGDLEEPWFDRTPFAELPTVNTVSAWQMLRQPALKSRAWADLQALRGNES